MKLRLASLSLALGLSALSISISGCGGGNATAPTAAAETSNVSGDAAAAAPAVAGESQVTVVDGTGTAPAQSVAVFLDSLRRGDETAANSMLTTLARTEMAKTHYVLLPLGTPEGQYQIGRVGFPYEDKTVALVECTWTEPATVNDPEASMEIVCEVHQETEGWRIARLGVTEAGMDDALVLDFEDAVSLQKTIDVATGAASSAATGPTGTPASQTTPGFPEGGYPVGADATGSATQQLAQPPNNNSPVLR